MDFSFKINYGPLFAAAAVLISAGAAYYYYRRTAAERNLRWVLTSLRFLAILFVLLLFLSPVLSLLGLSERKPVNIILIDNSSSVREIHGNNVPELLNSVKDNSGNETRTFLFSDGIIAEAGESDPGFLSADTLTGVRTDLTKTLRELRDLLPGENISSVTVITDGILNDGGNPTQAAVSLGAPVNFLLAGDTAGSKDLSIKKVLHGKTSFIESSVPVIAEIEARGVTGDARLNLYEDGRLLDSRTIQIQPDRTEYTAGFSVTSPSERTAHYTLTADSLQGEITFRNNSSDFFIRFIDNKFRLLVISGGPSADFAFIREQIGKIENFVTDFRTQKSAGEFYEGALPDLSGYDAVMLIGFPNSFSDDGILTSLSNKAERTNLPLLFFSSRNIDFNKLKLIEENLPFSVSSYSDAEQETSISVISSGEGSFFRSENMAGTINSLPPVFRTGTVFIARPGTSAIAVTGSPAMPAIIISESKDRRSAAFLAHGINRWRLGENSSAAEDALSYILANMVSAVARKDAGRKFDIETTSPVFSQLEPVTFRASVTGLEIKGGEKIRIKIDGPSYSNEFDMEKLGANEFTLSQKMPSKGVYDYEASLFSADGIAEKVTGKFLVEESSIEYLETKTNAMVMNEIANATGGKRLDGMPDSEIRNALTGGSAGSANGIRSSKNLDLKVNPYYLGIIILLLSVEWFLRKRNNLP